jgi:YgiT-type zinc finger domain-containing protein
LKKKNEKINKEAGLSEFEKLLIEEAPQACQECGGPVKFQKVNLEEFEGGKLFVIDDVPAFVCEECGETWIPKQFLDEFEKMIETVKKKKQEAKKKKN